MTQEAKTATGAPATLWDRTRRLASQEILETALRLFTEQGYDETSMAQIAREAGVSQRTLFRYFGTKEELLGSDQHRFGQVLMDTVGEQPADADAWEVLRAGIAAMLALHDGRERALERFRLLHNTASLRAGYLEKWMRFQADLLPAVEARISTGTTNTRANANAAGETSLRARAVLATVFACLDTATMAWVDNGGEGDIIDLYDACLAGVRG